MRCTRNNPQTKELLILQDSRIHWRNLRSPQGRGISISNSPLISDSSENQERVEELSNQENPSNLPRTLLNLFLEPLFSNPSHSASTPSPIQPYIGP